MWAHRGCFFLESFSFKDCCVQECSFYFWYFSNKLASRVISIGSLSMKSFIIFLVACKAGEFCCAIDLDFSTDRDLGRVKKWFQDRGWPFACPSSIYLWVALWGKKKKKKKKKAALQTMFLVHECHHKIPFQCFISINSNTDTNFTTTFNFVTSSLLLMASAFQYRWSFNHKLRTSQPWWVRSNSPLICKTLSA